MSEQVYNEGGERGDKGSGADTGADALPQAGLPAVNAGAAAAAGDGGGKKGTLAEADDGIKKIGRKNFASVYIAATEAEKREGKTGRVVDLSDQEAVVLRAYLKTLDHQAAAAEAGKKPDGTPRLTVESVKRMLRRPNLRAVIDAAILKAAAREEVDLDWLYSENRQVYEGDKKKDPGQMAAMKNLVELIKPRGPKTVIQQNNINSVYSGKSREDIDADWTDARRTATEGL